MVNTNNIYATDMLAQNVIKHYDKNLLKSDPQETPLEQIIEFAYGVKILYLNLSQNKTILGLTIFEDCIIPIVDTVNDLYCEEQEIYVNLLVESGTILIDESLLEEDNEQQYRYVLAHELAHWLIHQNYFSKTNDIASKMSCETTDQIELEADLLAISLLMPRGRVKVAFDRANSKFKRTTTITLLADIFNVSPKLLLKRLENMNIARFILGG